MFGLKKQEELLDNMNVLYVALSRAEEQLYVISNMNLTNKGEVKQGDMSSFFVNYLISKGLFEENKLEYEFGEKTKLSLLVKHVDASKPIESVVEILEPKKVKIAQREALMWGTHQQESIEYGNVIHEIMSFVKSKSDVDVAVEKSVENGLIHVEQKEKVSETILKVVNHALLESFFAEGNEVLNEQTIIQKEGRIIKPDRIVIDRNKEVLLLDYKTGAYQAKYQKQLEEYQQAIELMDLKVVQKALVFIGQEVEVVYL